MAVRDVCPMDGFERSVLKESARMHLESLKPVGEGGESESDIRCQEPHLLVVQVAFGSHHRHGQQNPLLTTKEVSQRFFV